MSEITHTIFIDFETYYDKEYSLKKIPAPLYIRDPRFKILGCAIAVNDNPAFWVEGDQMPDLDWENALVVAHNCPFDGMILVERCGIIPAMWGDTANMSRLLMPISKHSLANVSKWLDIGEKTDGLTEGSNTTDKKLVDYALNDVELCRKIYNIFKDHVPHNEQILISRTVSWAVDAKLHINQERLNALIDCETKKRNQLIAESGFPESVLRSNPQFAELLRHLGLEIPVKISQTTEEKTYAFGKNDPEFLSLMSAHPEYTHIWKGRKAACSNIAISRAGRFRDITALAPYTLPMPLKYYGAHTGRWSGDAKMNVQNLPRVDKKNKYTSLRECIEAPEGYVIVVADSSQIELRVNLWFSGQTDKLDVLRTGRDIYSEVAATHFNKPVEDITANERQFGKILSLGCGYGMGWEKFKHFCASGPLGMDPMLLSDRDAQQAIRNYRNAHPHVVQSWAKLQRHISCIADMNGSTKYQCLTLGNNTILMPNDTSMVYPNLEAEETAPEQVSWKFRYHDENFYRYLYGGLLQENIVQGLARIIVADQLLQIDQRYVTVSSTHDEVIFLAKEDEAEEALAYALKIMSTPPKWGMDIPLSAEGGYDKCYSK